MKKSISLYSIPVLSSLALLLTVFSCNKPQAVETRVPYVVPDSLMKTLVVDTVKTSNITDAIKFNGLVDFNTDKVVNIFPLISGNLENVSVMPGDFVKQ